MEHLLLASLVRVVDTPLKFKGIQADFQDISQHLSHLLDLLKQKGEADLAVQQDMVIAVNSVKDVASWVRLYDALTVPPIDAESAGLSTVSEVPA